MANRKPPGSSPHRPLHGSKQQLESIADPNVEIPGLDDDERDRMLTAATHGAKASGTMIGGAPRTVPTLGEEVTMMLARSDAKGKDGKGRG